MVICALLPCAFKLAKCLVKKAISKRAIEKGEKDCCPVCEQHIARDGLESDDKYRERVRKIKNKGKGALAWDILMENDKKTGLERFFCCCRGGEGKKEDNVRSVKVGEKGKGKGKLAVAELGKGVGGDGVEKARTIGSEYRKIHNRVETAGSTVLEKNGAAVMRVEGQNFDMVSSDNTSKNLKP
ncbi:hypothetical protein BS50DRAFT_590158 [Corynespora cassiicola Philippines]|uniref:Uncharacterized protein n=1 Tax=Corynespora cassiicola Philippines TaxID=1448308 RepID=A0A2T2NFV7_CORCC|nr:hypothetical protein BS50DRAFT_590158 [Corynespora cassiicola Philippines]